MNNSACCVQKSNYRRRENNVISNNNNNLCFLHFHKIINSNCVTVCSCTQSDDLEEEKGVLKLPGDMLHSYIWWPELLNQLETQKMFIDVAMAWFSAVGASAEAYSHEPDKTHLLYLHNVITWTEKQDCVATELNSPRT